MRGISKKIKQEIRRPQFNAVRGAVYSAHFRQISRAGLNLVFPPQPLWVTRGGANAQALTLIDDPQCAVCGFPFPYDLGEGALCGNCMATPPVYDRARAAFIYDEHSREPILSFKHGGQTHGLPVFTQQLARAGRDLFSGADLLVPVPLHPQRLRKRRFNQAALLARSLSRLKTIPLDTASLRRVKATQSQGGKTAAGRLRNMQGAFKVATSRAGDISGKNIIIIDDVMTTGATGAACARALKKSGAARVDLLSLARVTQEISPDAALADTIM